ncbi:MULTISPECIES: PRC-barrel domain-containing protein [unclassified Mesorhizobium]|uniref:PRC-barrel domain-containing protein n=1 Tax=unclassified Mesorhizobium TaxID=325217 RepID=UPI000BAF0EA0|nr:MULTISPECIES: PRC-barrel domain-containing protein [unclassified Mesorhizobium]PBC23486.1 photosystem reaction center subunit H [Mesorhizobium sp. WSM4311]TRD06852.1 PRC-barrel domain containing protein [Mesorhizobium sp. WSM4305]
MDHSAHVRLTANELTPGVLEDATIYGPNDEKIGSVSHTHGTGSETQVVIDVGGFLGIGAKPVSVPASQLDFMRDEDGDVHAVTSWTKDQLKAMPEHHDA